MPDYGALAKGFFEQFGVMRDYQAQQEQVKFNARLKLKEAALAEKESALNEQLLTQRINELGFKVREAQRLYGLQEKYMTNIDRGEIARKKVDTGEGIAQAENYKSLADDALRGIMALTQPGELFVSPEKKRETEVDIQGKLERIKTEQVRQEYLKGQTEFMKRRPIGRGLTKADIDTMKLNIRKKYAGLYGGKPPEDPVERAEWDWAQDKVTVSASWYSAYVNDKENYMLATARGQPAMEPGDFPTWAAKNIPGYSTPNSSGYPPLEGVGLNDRWITAPDFSDEDINALWPTK